MFDPKNLKDFICGVIDGLYFAESAIGCEDDQIDDLAGYDLSAASREALQQECAKFLDNGGNKAIENAIEFSQDYSYHQAGADFWLTRQGHGAGFWDRDIGHYGQLLSIRARSFPARCLMINAENEIEIA